MSSFTLRLGNLSHTLGTATSKRFQASGQQPCLCRMVRKSRGSDKLPSSTLGVRINCCTCKALRRFHQRCLWSPGITCMLQGYIGTCTSCLPLPAKTTWLYYLLKGAGVEAALPHSPGWMPRYDYTARAMLRNTDLSSQEQGKWEMLKLHTDLIFTGGPWRFLWLLSCSNISEQGSKRKFSNK